MLDAARWTAGLARDDVGPNAAAAGRLAFAGWCWRAAERVDPAQTREPALDAFHRATTTGATEPRLTAIATAYLARGGVRTATPPLVNMKAQLQPEQLTLNQQMRAFLFGVALYDVEQALGR